MTDAFELTPPEAPAPLPRCERLVDWQSLVGHTILAAIDTPSGKYECDALIITETHCWMALTAETDDGGGEASVQIIGGRYWDIAVTIADYASPAQLLRACVIGASECARLEAIQAEEKKKQTARRVHQLRVELNWLEGGGT